MVSAGSRTQSVPTVKMPSSEQVESLEMVMVTAGAIGESEGTAAPIAKSTRRKKVMRVAMSFMFAVKSEDG